MISSLSPESSVCVHHQIISPYLVAFNLVQQARLTVMSGLPLVNNHHLINHHGVNDGGDRHSPVKFFHYVILNGIVPHFFLSIKSHILDSDGVWYSSFWSEGSIPYNPLNLTILVLDFVPRQRRDLE